MKTIKSILEESKKLKKEVSDAVLKRKEELYVELKKKRKEFEDRYGEDADKVMHSTAMNMAKKEMSEEELQRRTMKDFEDHTPKEDDAGAYHKLVKRSGKRVADKDELDEEEVDLDERRLKTKYTRKLMKNKSVINYVRKQQEWNRKYVAKWGNEPSYPKLFEPRFDPGTGWTKLVIDELDLKKKLGKGDTIRSLRVDFFAEYEAVAKKLGLDKFGPKLGLGEANLKTVEKDVKKILSKVKINNKVSKQGNKFVVTITPNDEKDAQKALKNHPLYVAGKLRVMTEEVELDEAKQPKITGVFVFNPDFDEKGGKSSTKKLRRYGLKVNSVDEDDGDKVVEVTGTMDQMVKMVAGEGVGEEDTPAENPEMEISGNMFSDAEKKKLNMRKYDVTQRKKSAGIKRMGHIQVEILSGSKNDLQKMVLDVIPLSKAKKQHRELFALYVNEEVELDEALSSSLIKKLKKQYEPLRDKKVSLDNLKKMGNMIEKFGKEELIQLVKADIPFISQSAHTALMYKHNMSVSQIKKMKNEKVRFEDLVKKAANNLSELNWLVDLEGIGKVVIDGSSKGEVLSSLRKKMKNVDDIGDIERMTDTDKKKYFKMKYATVGKKEKEPEDTEIKEALDKELVTELSMFILNDAQIYKSRILPVIKNMKRKVASGKFDKKLAIKAFSYAVADGIKKYSKTFDVVKPSKQDKEQIANTLYDHYQSAIMEFTDKYKEIYDKLNEDNQERIDFMLDDDKEYDKVLEFVSQFQ